MSYEKEKQIVLQNSKLGQPLKPQARITPYRIKINGQYLTTRSGKTVWKRLGDAKNAFHNHLDYINHEYDYKNRPLPGTANTRWEMLKKWEEEGFLEFEPQTGEK